MHLSTISEISRNFAVSTRTLRYYEQLGLIKSIKKPDYAYRTYDDEAVTRLQQILVLRKLRIPLKQIGTILDSENTAEIMETFQRSLHDVDDEITALSTIRQILNNFIEQLNEHANLHIRTHPHLLDDIAVLDIVDSPALKKTIRQDKTVEALKMADEKINKLTDKDVRIIYLPPATVAASHYIGEEPEHHAALAMDRFVLENNLPQRKPDMRLYGFNHPNPGCIDETDAHGYEYWVTIPEDMEVPPPLVKKHFKGGLYGAHMISMGAFEEWQWLTDWAFSTESYLPALLNDNGDCMFGLLEEHLNYRNNVKRFADGQHDNIQLDLLVPIREKGKA